MVIVEDSYISIKYAKNFDWLNSGTRPDADKDGGEAPSGGNGPPPNQAIRALMPENVKKHFTQMRVTPEQLGFPGEGPTASGVVQSEQSSAAPTTNNPPERPTSVTSVSEVSPMSPKK